jgi:hypothetical protein
MKMANGYIRHKLKAEPIRALPIARPEPPAPQPAPEPNNESTDSPESNSAMPAQTEAAPPGRRYGDLTFHVTLCGRAASTTAPRKSRSPTSRSRTRSWTA